MEKIPFQSHIKGRIGLTLFRFHCAESYGGVHTADSGNSGSYDPDRYFYFWRVIVSRWPVERNSETHSRPSTQDEPTCFYISGVPRYTRARLLECQIPQKKLAASKTPAHINRGSDNAV